MSLSQTPTNIEIGRLVVVRTAHPPDAVGMREIQLITHSRFFEAALRPHRVFDESIHREVTLSQAETGAFDIWASWLEGDLRPGLLRRHGFKQAIKAWILADFLMCSTCCRNDIMRMIHHIFTGVHSTTDLCKQSMRLLKKVPAHSSPSIRRFLIDMVRSG